MQIEHDGFGLEWVVADLSIAQREQMFDELEVLLAVTSPTGNEYYEEIVREALRRRLADGDDDPLARAWTKMFMDLTDRALVATEIEGWLKARPSP